MNPTQKQATTMTTNTRKKVYEKPILEVVDLKAMGLMEQELGIHSTSLDQERGGNETSDKFTFAREAAFGDISYDTGYTRQRSIWE